LRYVDPSGHRQCEGAITCDGDAKRLSTEEKFVLWYYFGDDSVMRSASREESHQMISMAYGKALTIENALKYFIAGVLTGAALASPAAIVAAFEVATTGTTTAAITAGAVGASASVSSGAVVSIGLVKGAGLFESSFLASSGIKVGGIAEVAVKGKHITLRDIAIYADGVNDSKNLIGAKDIIQWRNAVIEELKKQGYQTLTIQGIRVENSTSANPGMIIDRTFDLTK